MRALSLLALMPLVACGPADGPEALAAAFATSDQAAPPNAPTHSLHLMPGGWDAVRGAPMTFEMRLQPGDKGFGYAALAAADGSAIGHCPDFLDGACLGVVGELRWRGPMEIEQSEGRLTVRTPTDWPSDLMLLQAMMQVDGQIHLSNVIALPVVYAP